MSFDTTLRFYTILLLPFLYNLFPFIWDSGWDDYYIKFWIRKLASYSISICLFASHTGSRQVIFKKWNLKDVKIYFTYKVSQYNFFKLFRYLLSNGHSTANLSNSSTHQKFAIFGKFEYSPKWPFLKIGRTRLTHWHLPTWFARTRQTNWHSPTWFTRTRLTRRHSPTCFAWTRQTRRFRQI
jgi:hypothetical protein